MALPLSSEFIEQLEDTKVAVDEFFERRLGEIDDQVSAMRTFSVSLSNVGQPVVLEAVDVAVGDVEGYGLQVIG